MKELIRAKGKVVTLKVAKVFEEFKEKLLEKGEKVIVFFSSVYPRTGAQDNSAYGQKCPLRCKITGSSSCSEDTVGLDSGT